MSSFIEIVAYGLILLMIISFLLISICDCDLTLKFCEVFGKSKLEEIKDRTVWITGASSGIGAALAIDYAQFGAKLVLSARSEEKLKEIKAKCLEAGRIHMLEDKDILVLPMDMCDFDSHKPAFDKVIEHFGKISVMIHNAGRSQRARWEHINLQVDREVFDLNVFSVVNLTRLIIPHFIANGDGNFAIMSSLAGKFGVPFSGTYTGSKHAINGYFESLRTEKLGTGINITVLCPGPVFSNFLATAATENPGEALGGRTSSTDRRMKTERCARLSIISIAHNLHETWLALFPLLPLMYVSQYMPYTSKKLVGLVGPKFMQKLRDSKETIKAN